MKTPSRLALNSSEELANLVQEHVLENYEPYGEVYVCKNCGAEVKWISARISVHDQPLDRCGGGGKVKRVCMPYCPNCELTPEDRGCIHLPSNVKGR